MIERLGRLGCSEDRARLDIMDVASDQYSFDDHAHRRFIEAVDDAVDPSGVVSPGRRRIRPARRRGGLPPGRR